MFYVKQEGRCLFTKYIFCQNQILMGALHCFILTSKTVLFLLVYSSTADLLLLLLAMKRKERLGEAGGRGQRGALVIYLCLFYLFYFTHNLINAFLLSKTFQRTSAEPYEGLRLSFGCTKVLD